MATRSRNRPTATPIRCWTMSTLTPCCEHRSAAGVGQNTRRVHWYPTRSTSRSARLNTYVSDSSTDSTWIVARHNRLNPLPVGCIQPAALRTVNGIRSTQNGFMPDPDVRSPQS